MEIFSGSNLGPRVQSFPKGKSLTKQSFREESEINNIMARYVKTGLIDHFGQFGGEYGFASSVDFHSAMNVVTKADQMFEALPADIRRRFHDDPADFLDFVQSPENQEELVVMGLANKAEVLPVPGVAAPVVPAAPITPEVVVDPVPAAPVAEAP